MVEFGGRYAKWNKSDRERQILYHYQLYVKSKKTLQISEYKKKEMTHRYREQTTGYWWGEGREQGLHRGRGEEVQIITYKIIHKNILHSIGNIANIL